MERPRALLSMTVEMMQQTMFGGKWDDTTRIDWSKVLRERLNVQLNKMLQLHEWSDAINCSIDRIVGNCEVILDRFHTAGEQQEAELHVLNIPYAFQRACVDKVLEPFRNDDKFCSKIKGYGGIYTTKELLCILNPSKRTDKGNGVV